MWHLKSNRGYSLRQEAVREGDGKRVEKEIARPWQVHDSIQIVAIIENQSVVGHLAHKDGQWWVHILKGQEGQPGTKQPGKLHGLRCPTRRLFTKWLERGQWLQHIKHGMLQRACWWPRTRNPCSIWRRTECHNWFRGRKSKIGKLWEDFPLVIQRSTLQSLLRIPKAEQRVPHPLLGQFT